MHPRAKNDHQLMVEKFMVKSGNKILPTPGIPDKEERVLCARILLEEVFELLAGLGVEPIINVAIPLEAEELELSMLTLYAQDPNDESSTVSLIEIADGVADVVYTATWCASACGIAMGPIQNAVDVSNLRKFRGDAHRDPDTGKWIKPSDWKVPDIKKLLDNQDKSYKIDFETRKHLIIDLSTVLLISQKDHMVAGAMEFDFSVSSRGGVAGAFTVNKLYIPTQLVANKTHLFYITFKTLDDKEHKIYDVEFLLQGVAEGDVINLVEGGSGYTFIGKLDVDLEERIDDGKETDASTTEDGVSTEDSEQKDGDQA